MISNVKKKLIASSVIPLFVAAAASAQDVPSMGQNWTEDTTQTFFSDDGSMTLRSSDEIQTSWGSLTEEERSLVRAECVAMETASAGDSGVTQTGTGQTNASTFGEATTGTDSATGSVTVDSTVESGAPAETGTGQTDPSTFGEAETGTDSSGAAADSAVTGVGESSDATPDPAADGTGQTNASTFGTAATGTGMDQVTDETWQELCVVVNDL